MMDEDKPLLEDWQKAILEKIEDREKEDNEKK